MTIESIDLERVDQAFDGSRGRSDRAGRSSPAATAAARHRFPYRLRYRQGRQLSARHALPLLALTDALHTLSDYSTMSLQVVFASCCGTAPAGDWYCDLRFR